MNNTSSLSSLIWSSADDVLRGLFKPSEYGRVILPFVVMRRLDCVLEPKKDEVYELYYKLKDQLSDPSPVILRQVGLPFFNTSKYDLVRLKSDPNNIFQNFKNYLDGYSETVSEIIKHFSLMPILEKLNENNRLYILVDKFTEFDLHPDRFDNHQMGSIYEELLRLFSEMSNEESGDHYTPRDVVKLLVSLIFSDEEGLQGEGLLRSIYDPCCGTGGMLTISKQWINDNVNENLKIDLYGQTLLPESYAICKSDFLILGENPTNIGGPKSTLSDDKFPGRRFDFMITNPPFGVSWKSDESFVKEESKDPGGRFSHGTPWVKDGQLLFLSHMISKMEPTGSVIGIVTNGSPLTTGDGLRGESQFRKYLVENDLIDSIYILPDDLFFNTGILSYLWVLKNKKDESRQGSVRVVNCIDEYTKMYKPIGDKRKLISEENLKNILSLKNSDVDRKVRYFDNDEFLYNYVTLHRKKLGDDGLPIKDKKGAYIKLPNHSEKVKIPVRTKIVDYISQLDNSNEIFFLDDEVVVGCELHLTKYFYEAEKVVPLHLVKSTFNETTKEFLESVSVFSSETGESIDADTNWFGSIPSHWSVLRIDHCFSQRTEKVDQKNYNALSVTKSGVIPQLDHVAKSSESGNRSLVMVNDFVINSRSDRKGSCGVSDLNGCVSSVNTVLIPNQSIVLPKFIHGLFRTKEFQEEFYRYGKGIVDDLWTTSWSEMRDILIPVPPLDEQDKIAKRLEDLDNLRLLVKKLSTDFDQFELSLKSSLVFKGS